jgi:hypothetical protein
VGGYALDLDIPWDKLDAYSEARSRETTDNNVSSSGLLCDNSAPEWNWWCMLKCIDLKFACKCFCSVP